MINNFAYCDTLKQKSASTQKVIWLAFVAQKIRWQTYYKAIKLTDVQTKKDAKMSSLLFDTFIVQRISISKYKKYYKHRISNM